MYKILICDDDHDIVSALKIYLTSEGYQTVEAYNGQEALEAVEAGGIDLVLMDVMMPKMDGIRATARMREEGNIPIILLTPIEYNILHLLMKNPGRVYSTAQIYQLVWNDPVLGSENTVAVHIRHLREKIEIDPANPHYLKVVWGLGYKMEKMV